MNILFVNYGDFTSNSLNHIAAFADQLTRTGHACVVAVPENPETISVIREPLFTPVTFDRALEPEPLFPDRGPADVVHAWTPRENVREFTLAYLRKHPGAALVIHLEDNEALLLERFAAEPLEVLRQLSDEELAARLSPRLAHPVRFKNFLRVAHAVTYITDRLCEFIPDGKPSHRLLPGIDFKLHPILPSDPTLRSVIGVGSQEKIIVFTGGTTFANLADIRSLLLAVRLINERGTPCKLVRTGINPPQFAQELEVIGSGYVIELGFVEKDRLPALLALADVLVQPGAPNRFNDYRLPSKIPEFLCAGRPVVVPRANIALEMEDGLHALLLETGQADEIVDRCLRIFHDEALARRLSEGGPEFARTHFDLTRNTGQLASFYQRITASAQPIFSDPGTPPSEDVLLAEGDVALRMRAKEWSLADRWQKIIRLQGKLQTQAIELEAARNRILTIESKCDALAAELQATRDRISTTESERDANTAALQTARDHISIVESERDALATELQATRDRVSTTESERDANAAALQTARDHISIVESERQYLSTKLQGERHKVELFRAQLADTSASLGSVIRSLDETKSRTEAITVSLRQRDEKVARMSRSFSWRVTAPLRSLRRTFVDRLRKESGNITQLAPQPIPQPDPSLISVIDTPIERESIPPAGSVHGWTMTADGTAIVAVRACGAGAVFDARYGIDRPDVAIAHPNVPGASTSGFTFEYMLPSPSTQHLVIEALTEDGRWRCIAASTVHVGIHHSAEGWRDYVHWVQRFDTPSLDQMVSVRAWIETLDPAQCPHISLLMPTYNPPAQWLVKAIESVRAQYYPHWELCIADDASTEPHVRRILEDYARRDERIRIMLRETNGHISAASNSALALATGEFIALLDHDDELAPHALSEVVLALVQQPDLEFIYSDEDKIDEHGQRFTPYFKPDWNPDLLLAQNYTSHFSVFRTTRLRAIGGFREGYEGSQDWDLTLRATEGLDPARIRHLPRVLYHWRAIPGSTALSVDEKSYPVEAARKALADHFDRCGERVDLELLPGNYWRAKRALPQAIPLVSLVIPTRNRVDLLSTCLGSILEKTRYPRFEIIVVDNRSDDPATLDYLSRLDSQRIRVLRYDEPFNYSAINNYAAAHVRGEIIGLLNNDLEVINGDWLDEMVSQAVRPEIGCVGAMLYYPDDTIQHAGVILGLGGVANHAYYKAPRSTDHHFNRAHLVQSYSAVTGACLLVRKEIFDTIGGLNEQDLPIAFNDVDFCLRVMEAGYRNLWTPFAEFYHHESATRGTEDTSEKLERFKNEVTYMRQRWGRLLDNDPAYNRNLSLQHQDFSLSFPPR